MEIEAGRIEVFLLRLVFGYGWEVFYDFSWHWKGKLLSDLCSSAGVRVSLSLEDSIAGALC